MCLVLCNLRMETLNLLSLVRSRLIQFVILYPGTNKPSGLAIMAVYLQAIIYGFRLSMQMFFKRLIKISVLVV